MSDEDLRALDAEIHAKVFGKASMYDVGELLALRDGEDCYDDESDPVPYYTSDIGAAWLVVEKIGVGLLTSVVRMPHDGSWGCRIGTTASVGHASAPVAICKAALKFLRETR